MKYALAVTAVLALAAGAAVAGEKGAAMTDWDAKFEAHFIEVDVNADRQLTEQEVVDYHVAKAKREFAAMTAGGGVATYDVVKAHHKAKHAEMMKESAAMADDKGGHGGKH